MYLAWTWGGHPHPHPQEAETTTSLLHPLPLRATPSTVKKGLKNEKTTISSSSLSTTSSSTSSAFLYSQNHSLSPSLTYTNPHRHRVLCHPSPSPSTPYEGQPSQVCLEKHRGVPSLPPPQLLSLQQQQQQQHIQPQVTSSHNTILLLYETCRRSLTISRCWPGVPTLQATFCGTKQAAEMSCGVAKAMSCSATAAAAAAAATTSSVHSKGGQRSLIQGCNIVQIMSPTLPSPDPSTPAPVGDSAIRSNSPSSLFSFANLTASTSLSSSSSCYSSCSSLSSTASSSSFSSSHSASSCPLFVHPHEALSTTTHRHCHIPHEDTNGGGKEGRRGGMESEVLSLSWRRRSTNNGSNSIHSRRSSLSQSLFLLTVMCLLLAGGAEGSELPDRECCDSVPPPPPNYHHATSTTTTTTTPAPKSEFNTSISISSHTTGGVMNCIEARHQCLNDPGCKDVLMLLHKVCGAELVACSSTTPTKCQMLLRTLRNFDYLASCKCNEPPSEDFICHTFRETIFSHPCSLIETDGNPRLGSYGALYGREYPEYGHSLMPNCKDAYEACKDKASCLKAYMDFVNVCAFNGITCMAQDSDKCMESWNKIRQSPVFGCVCTSTPTMRVLASRPYSIDSTHSGFGGILRKSDPNQETCIETYNHTHENPCLEIPSPPLRVDFISPLYRPLDFFYRPLDLSSVLGHPVPNRDDVRTFLPMAPWGHIFWDGPDDDSSPHSLGQKDISKHIEVEIKQATCHVALEQCQSDEECRRLLDDVMVWCEHSHCEPDRCRTALQEFYDRVSIIRRLQVAFCVCRQKDPDGECLTAMRKLHPTCAERHTGRDPMKCHKIAEQCRKNPICREKLREYEQKCAADAMTGRCADTHRNCQKAVMNILGTELHATCVCKGTDFLNQHDCYTWQKLLWSNPCVIESHLMLHDEIKEGAEGLDEVFRRPTLRTTPPPPRKPYVPPTPEEDEFIRKPGGYGIVRQISPDGTGPRPSVPSYGQERTSSWDTRHRPPMGGDRERGGGIFGGRDGERGGLTIGGGSDRGRHPISRIGYDPPRGSEDDEVVSSRGRFGGGLAGETSGRRGGYSGVLAPDSGYGEPKWGSGRNRGGGLNVGGRNNGYGSPRESLGESEPVGGRRSWGSSRGSGRTNGRERGGVYNPDQAGNGYGGRGRVTGGHRGTSIAMGTPDRESDLGHLDFGGPRRRPGGSWAATGRGEYGRGDLPDETGSLPTRSPPHRGPYEPLTPPAGGVITPTPPAMPDPTIQITTTTGIPTTTKPRRTCSINVKNEQMVPLEIPEGSSRRIYNTSDCSELCECRSPNGLDKPEASCKTLRCIENKSCNTESAKYPHTAPYYLAYRGVCDCYNGNFICQKPDPNDYKPLVPGVYLFLGYSKGEMEILKPFTSKDELDALKQMEDVLIKDYGFKCSLKITNHVGENVIAVAKLNFNPDVFMNAYTRQRREKKECEGPLQNLAEKINTRPRHSDILMDAHLSMFILAKVEVNYPEAQTSSSTSTAAARSRPDVALTHLVPLLTFLLLLLLQRQYLETRATLGTHAT